MAHTATVPYNGAIGYRLKRFASASPTTIGYDPPEPWLAAPDQLELLENTVHVWRTALRLSPASLDHLAHTLTPDEQARAARFVFREDRQRFVAGRGILRALLGRYSRHDPASLRFEYGTYGKPALSPAFNPDGLRFSLAHSGDLALYAFAVGRELGVDVEAIRVIEDGPAVAAATFSPAEHTALRALPRELWLPGFFRCWTRKEAYVKARGLGLSLPLQSFDVSVAPGEPPRLLIVRGEPEEAARWTLHDLLPAPGYLGALAVEGQGARILRLDWTPR